MAQNKSKLRSLWELTAGQRRRYLLAAIAMTIGIALLYLSPLIVRATIDGLIQQKPVGTGEEIFVRVIHSLSGDSITRALLIAAISVIAVTALGGAFTYLKGQWAALASESIARQLRNRLYDHLQHVSVVYHDKAQTGDLVQRCTSDVDTVRLFYASQLVELARCIVLAILALIIFLRLDWKITPVAMAMLPIVLAFALVFFKRVQNSFKAMDEAEGAMTAVLQENLTGIRVVRAFSRQEFEVDKFEKRNRTHRDLNYKLFWIMSYYWAFSDFLCLAQTAIVLMVGGWRVAHGAMSVGTLVAFLTLVSMLIWPVRQMGRILSELGKAMVALGRIQEILAEPEESQPQKPAEGLSHRAKGAITLRDLSFSHDTRQILHGINLTIHAGETVAFLGPSGSGKTTLV
ncbi:MAG TPA: ABC transporter transmembrane domain-containing protein, partial [Tepidisphaeraceae bacterium]|nr:ABC transporter transmembrane domain-containing protein [Tepidisphaeraceae bacterium]